MISELVAGAFRIPFVELAAATRRSASAARARQTAMYLAHVVVGLSYRDIARGFGRDPCTVVHACRLIEDRREDPRIDALMARLEHACVTVVTVRRGDEP